MKNTKRKGFNFFRSYYDVYNELSDRDKLVFIEALLDRQFLGIKPKNLKGMANFAWISQVNSIDSQVKGFEDKTGIKLTPTEGGSDTPTEQVEGKVEEEVQDVVPFSEKVTKFLELFNKLKQEKGYKSNCKVLSNTDKNNLKQLKGYTTKEFKLAIKEMLETDWARETGNQTPAHILRVDNFNRYLSKAINNPKHKEETDEERVKRLTQETKDQ